MNGRNSKSKDSIRLGAVMTHCVQKYCIEYKKLEKDVIFKNIAIQEI